MKDTFKSKPQSVTPIPSLDFKKIQRQIVQAAEDINKLSNSSFMLKMRKTILSADTDTKGTHVDASIIGNKADNAEISALVSKIASDPVSTAARVKLVRSVMHDKRDFPLSFYRNLLIQAALTIYLGNITPATLQIAGQTYRLYLEKIITTHKKNLLVVHSKQLKNVNLDVISVKDLIKADDENEEDIDENEAMVIQEIKITLKLLEYTDSLDEDTRGSITMSMQMDELDELTSKHRVKSLFGGADSAKNKHTLVVRKTLAALEVMKRIPVLHPIGLKIVAKLQVIDSKLPLPYLMEARLHMQALRILTLRVVMRDLTARPSMTPTFNKAIVAYHKALKRSSFTNPKRGDITVLSEFAQIAYYAYEQRKMLSLANHGVLKILEMGKKAVDVLAPRNRAYLNQQKQIQVALKSMRRYG
ncbi:MAG: hypothetical protein QGI53_06070 [SAR324 cluster bacterium]|uniref:Uncharacterized protein n=1 Tax=marine metagenome TaxID=408172 RepID=A0A381QD15_9ZZZZ|nr:hypothetical protein [SAR324 cluster bacterium]MDP7438991.1 hypothetical protein [SAR324 cluster bacterium]MDP7581747.1 hypothetical protein [SAR324 cluster bacterium]MDP7614996.1 hypothetical protein [SAR324 cluster bacterium]